MEVSDLTLDRRQLEIPTELDLVGRDFCLILYKKNASFDISLADKHCDPINPSDN